MMKITFFSDFNKSGRDISGDLEESGLRNKILKFQALGGNSG